MAATICALSASITFLGDAEWLYPRGYPAAQRPRPNGGDLILSTRLRIALKSAHFFLNGG